MALNASMDELTTYVVLAGVSVPEVVNVMVFHVVAVNGLVGNAFDAGDGNCNTRPNNPGGPLLADCACRHRSDAPWVPPPLLSVPYASEAPHGDAKPTPPDL